METFDLEQAITTILERRAAAAVAEQKEQARAQAARKQEQLRAFMDLIQTTFGASVVDALHMAVVWNTHGWNTPSLTFRADGEQWELDEHQAALRQLAPAVRSGTWEEFDHRTGAPTILDQLLERIATRRVERAAIRERQAEATAQRATEAAEQARRTASHERCVVQITEAVNTARAQLWQWPTGREITIYRWSWCTAAGTDEASAEYAHGYSLADRLDADGYVLIAQDRYQQGRLIRLDMLSHKPVVERLVIGNTAALTSDLRETVEMEIAGIGDRGGESRHQYYEAADQSVRKNVGSQPLAWVRALADNR